MDALLMDEFMPNSLRRDVAMRLPETHTAGGKTDWAAVERILLDALASGDWSDLARTAYSRQNANDLQLGALVAVARKMNDAGESARAKAMVEKGAKILGYDRPPAAVLAAENKTIPSLFERATLAQVKERFGVLEKCRALFDRAEMSADNGTDLVDLDE